MRQIPAKVLRCMWRARRSPTPTRACTRPCWTRRYEIEHISDHQQRVWLRTAIESGRFRTSLTDDERRTLLRRLTEVEGMERYLRRAFLGRSRSRSKAST